MSRDEAIALAIKDELFVARFWAKVDKSGECWTWTGDRVYGYGRVFTSNGRVKAHRLAWAVANNKTPGALCVLHSCDNRPCVNPAHLRLGTNADNNADMVERGQQVRGERNGSAKLTEANVREIRALNGTGLKRREIGDMFGLADSTICAILKGRKWKHVT